MSAPRDPYGVVLRCPHCRTTGIAMVTDAERRPDHLPPRAVFSSIPASFRISKPAPTSASTEFRCTHCDEIAG